MVPLRRLAARTCGILTFVAGAAAAAGAAGAWKEATPGRPIVLPADHASHPDYKIEWWYYTGNLDAGGGQRLGYQLTFFRIGVDPVPVNPSRWAVRDLYMTHLALTDVTGRTYRFTERMNRAGPGWAGASTTAYRVWNEDWEAVLGPDGVHHLTARTADFGLDLTLDERRPAVLHGDHGYSRKGAAPANASHYYSLTRMPTRGTITLGGRAFAVTGLSWMDHEFGTSFLEREQVGWDWFSIQLDDGRDLMIFQLRRADGSIDPRSSGTLVEPDGKAIPITVADGFRLTPGRTWTSAASGARYPVAWTIDIPARRLTLAVTAAVNDQELRAANGSGVTYWEGAIDVTGQGIRGRGYLEMTGYAGAPMGRFLR